MVTSMAYRTKCVSDLGFSLESKSQASSSRTSMSLEVSVIDIFWILKLEFFGRSLDKLECR